MDVAQNSAQTSGIRLGNIRIVVRQVEPAARILSAVSAFQLTSGPIEDPMQRVLASFPKRAGADLVDVEGLATSGDDFPGCVLVRKSAGSDDLCVETSYVGDAPLYADTGDALLHEPSFECFAVSGPAPAIALGGRRVASIYSPHLQLFDLLEPKTSSEVSELNGNQLGFP